MNASTATLVLALIGVGRTIYQGADDIIEKFDELAERIKARNGVDPTQAEMDDAIARADRANADFQSITVPGGV